MSRQSFQAFMGQLQKDGSLQKELREKLGDPAQGVSAEGLNQFAAAKGYDFKVDEIMSELNEKQLDSVAGGLSFSNPLSLTYHKVQTALTDTHIKIDFSAFKW
jgi:predicted ribosomally synthesized peptide with nif11-like leader